MSDPSPAPAPRTARNPVLIRLTVAPLILVVVVGVLWLHRSADLPALTFALLAVFAGGGALELSLLLRRPHPACAVVVPLGIAAGLALLPWLVDLPGERMTWRVGGLLLGGTLVLLRHIQDVRPEALGVVMAGLLPLGLVALPFSFLGEMARGPDGAMRLLFVVVTAKACDMGGWLAGKPFGKHKILPTVSPGKSWEGAAGGIGLSVVAALFLPGLLDLPEATHSVGWRVGFGVLMGVASLVAAFLWSGFKRRLGAKDSSTLIPEMGGILDLIDTLLVAAPLAWAWYVLLPGS